MTCSSLSVGEQPFSAYRGDRGSDSCYQVSVCLTAGCVGVQNAWLKNCGRDLLCGLHSYSAADVLAAGPGTALASVIHFTKVLEGCELSSYPSEVWTLSWGQST